MTFLKTGSLAYGYVAILFLGFIPQFWARPWVDFAILTAIYLLVHEGLWHALNKFPWQTEGLSARHQSRDDARAGGCESPLRLVV